MTNLNKTSLTTSQKIECAANVIAMQDHGDKTQLSEEYNISRPTLYNVEETTHEVLKHHFESSEYIYIKVDQAQLERTVIGMRVIGANSYRNIEDILPIIYPDVSLSYGSIQSLSVEAGENAKDYLEKTNLSSIDAAAVDEMFSQGDPVLAGVDLDSGFLFGLEHHLSRSEEDWRRFFEQGQKQGLDLSVVVKDAAPGIAAGVQAVFPNAEQRDDCFHVLYELNKVHARLERQSYSAIQTEIDLHKKLANFFKPETDREILRSKIIEYDNARQRCQKIIEQFDRVDEAKKKIRQALECIDIEKGSLRSGDEVEKMMTEAADSIHQVARDDCKKVATYIGNRAFGLALATHDLMARLENLKKIHSPMIVLLCCLIWQALGQLDVTKTPRKQAFLKRYLAGAWTLLKQEEGESWEEVYSATKQELEHHHRASSAIEGFNSALRPHLYVHKSVSQNFLDLFRAYYNLRKRRWGKYKGTSAHETLTGESISDWLTEIGYPPSKTLH